MTVCFYGYRIFWERKVKEKLEAALADLLRQDDEIQFYFCGCDVLNWIAYDMVRQLQQEHAEKKITLTLVTGPRQDDAGLLGNEVFDETMKLTQLKWYQKDKTRRRTIRAWLLANSDVALCYQYDDFYEEGDEKPDRIPVGLRGVRVDLAPEESYRARREKMARMPKPLHDVFVRWQAGVPAPEIARQLKIPLAQLRVRQGLMRAYLGLDKAREHIKRGWQQPWSIG